MKYSFSPEELTSEKSLWDIYKQSRRITPSRFQKYFVMLVTLALATNSFYFSKDNVGLLSDIRSWSELGFGFSITTLGFLIAGFTIFATLSRPRMMLAMMDHINEDTGLPTLKYNFFAFMKVFIAYLVISVLYLVVVLFGQSGGMVGNIIDVLPNSDQIRTVVIKAVYPIVGGSFVYLLMLLKSFIFNVFAIVMNFLRWEYMESQEGDP